MLDFIGIWYNPSREVKRDRVKAKDANEASCKIHALYAGKKEPAPCLTVIPAGGSYGHSGPEVSMRGGPYGD